MAGFVKPRDGLTALRISTALHLGAGLGLVALGAWAGAELLALPKQHLVQSIAVFAAIAAVAFIALPQHLPRRAFGNANRITLMRAVIAALFAGLIGKTGQAAEAGWLLAVLAAVSLALDGLDGWAARRGGMASRFGARFDMELDAFFILVLSALVFEQGKAGAWVLLSGLLRYAFVGAAALWPRLRRPLPASRRRRAICSVQTGALVLCITPLAAPPFSSLVAAAALGLLALSFAADIAWLLRHGTREGESP